jgi:glyoxylate/hydroxypyruvate/2-ketogluconate reductase
MNKPKIGIVRGVFPEVLARLEQHFDVVSNQSDTVLTKDQIIAMLADCDGAYTTGGDRMDAEVFANCPRLKIVANMAVGYNNFDIPAFNAAGVQATNTPDVLTETTADFGFALMMATARRITESEHYLRAGKWNKWSFDMFAGSDIHGATLGILGMGRIGQGIARRGSHGFGMKVIYHNRSKLDSATEERCRATYVTKEKLLKSADHLVLVLPYSPENHHTIGAKELLQMKPTATLTNIARGGIVDDAALAAALQAKTIAAAGIDVFEGEPSVHPELLKQTNVVLTPHIASSSVPTRMAMANLAADNLIAFFAGEAVPTPINNLNAASLKAKA